MLVEFAIEIDAIDGSTDNSVINRLLDIWRNYGVLISPEKRDPLVARRFESLRNAGLRKRWKTAWEHILKQTRNAYRWVPVNETKMTGWSAITNKTDLARYDFIDMAILKQKRAEDLGIDQGYPKLCGSVEGARIHDADQTSKVQTSKLLSNKNIEHGVLIEDLWIERFKRFSETSRAVGIVDKFAFRKGNIQGLYHFLDLLNQHSQSSKVIIYASPDPGRHPNEEIPRIQQNLGKQTDCFKGNGIKTIEIHFLRESLFRIDGHDRHVRFDNNIFDIGIGVIIFTPPNTRFSTATHMYALAPSKEETTFLNPGTFPPIPKEHLLDQRRANDAKNPATQTITITYPL